MYVNGIAEWSLGMQQLNVSAVCLKGFLAEKAILFHSPFTCAPAFNLSHSFEQCTSPTCASPLRASEDVDPLMLCSTSP